MSIRIPYDATRASLYEPFSQPTPFAQEAPGSDDILCAELARLAYRKFESSPAEEQAVRNILTGFGLPNGTFFAQGGTQAFLASNQDKAILAFRGTEGSDPTDLGTDLVALLMPWSAGGRVHAGFATALRKVWDGVETALQHVSGKIFFTGHSLGAALATVATSLHRPSALVTFGCPRAGDAAFAAHQNFKDLKMHRYVNCCDLVCRIPPESMRYKHVSKKYYIDRKGKITFHPAASRVVADQMRARVEYLVKYAFQNGAVGVRDLADHAPINYVSALTGR